MIVKGFILEYLIIGPEDAMFNLYLCEGFLSEYLIQLGPEVVWLVLEGWGELPAVHVVVVVEVNVRPHDRGEYFALR